MTSHKLKGEQYAIVAPWVSEMCILAVLSCGDSYGYEIAKSSKTKLSESTIYPILRRLEERGCLESYSQVNDAKLRRIYTITVDGQTQFSEYKRQWGELSNMIRNVIKE